MLNKISLVLFCLVAFGCGKNNQKQKSNFIPETGLSEKFFSKTGKFKILFEENPSLDSLHIPYENGEILMHSFIYEKGINLIFCISYVDYPQSFTDTNNTDEFLNRLLETYLNAEKAGVEIKKMIVVNTWPGLYFKASNSDTFVFGEYILKKNRLYQLTVTKEGNYHNNAEVNTFFNSLELL